MTRDQIKTLLATSTLAVQRAMVALYRRQTVSEQHTSTTSERNGRGFNAFDADRGTYYAKWVLSGKSLTGYHIDRARRIALRYVGQLAEMSEQVVPVAQPITTSVKVNTEGALLAYIAHHDPFHMTPAEMASKGYSLMHPAALSV
jgi:hypothetical protein